MAAVAIWRIYCCCCCSLTDIVRFGGGCCWIYCWFLVDKSWSLCLWLVGIRIWVNWSIWSGITLWWTYVTIRCIWPCSRSTSTSIFRFESLWIIMLKLWLFLFFNSMIFLLMFHFRNINTLDIKLFDINLSTFLISFISIYNLFISFWSLWPLYSLNFLWLPNLAWHCIYHCCHC